MSDPLFTVVLPTYNRAGMLRSALESVLWQTCADYECFVLDNASSDRTAEVFAEYAGRPRLRFHRFAVNGGVSQSRNHAIRNARGRFITFLDSDDLWLPQRLARFAELVEAAPRAGFVFSNAYVFRYGRVIGTVFPRDKALPAGRVPGWYAVGDRHLPYLTTNLAIAREAFERIGLYRPDIRLLDDTELYSRFLAAGREVAATAEPLAVCTAHAEQATHDYAGTFADAMLAVRSGGAPPEVEADYRRALARAAAANMAKSGRPGEARAFLAAQGVAPDRALAALTACPAALLRLGRRLRGAYLALRYGGLLAPAEYARVRERVLPLMAAGRADGGGHRV